MTFSKAEVTKAYRAMETDSGGDRQKDTTTDRKEKGGRDSERDRETERKGNTARKKKKEQRYRVR